MKICSCCKKTRIAEEYYSYWKTTCKFCARDKQKKRDQENRTEARIYGYEFLKTHPCEHCGESNPLVLEFHHRDPKLKKYHVGTLLSNGRGNSSTVLKRVKEEIQKCIVLCSNCHTIVTCKERDTFRYRMWQLDNSYNSDGMVGAQHGVRALGS